MIFIEQKLGLAGYCTLALLVFSPAAATAQDPRPKHLTLLGIPSATTAPRGVVFGQVSHSMELDSDAEDRTVLSFGFGFGDADNGLGGQVTAVGAPDTTNFDSFSYLGAKVSRRLASFESPTYAGISVNQIAGSGEASDLDPTVSLIFTRFGTQRSETSQDVTPYMITAGVGSHIRNDGEDPGVFFGAGIGLSPALGVSAAWSGEHVDLGASLRFERFRNARFSIVLSDALKMEDQRQVTVGLSWAFDTGQWR